MFEFVMNRWNAMNPAEQWFVIVVTIPAACVLLTMLVMFVLKNRPARPMQAPKDPADYELVEGAILDGVLLSVINPTTGDRYSLSGWEFMHLDAALKNTQLSILEARLDTLQQQHPQLTTEASLYAGQEARQILVRFNTPISDIE